MTAPAVPGLDRDAIQKMIDDVLNSAHRRHKLQQFAEQAEKLRKANEQLETKVAELTAKIPTDGSVTLTKEQGVDWAAYLALGKPADLKTIATEHTDLKAKQLERDAEEQYADAAEALGWENVAVATRWLKREPIVLTFQDVRTKDEDGKTIVTRTPMVRAKSDEKAAPIPLADYVDEQAPEFAQIFASAPDANSDDDADEDTGHTGRVPVREARNAGGNGNGVPIAAMRGAKLNATPAGREKKKLEEIEQSARGTGAYSI